MYAAEAAGASGHSQMVPGRAQGCGWAPLLPGEQQGNEGALWVPADTGTDTDDHPKQPREPKQGVCP